MSDEAVRKEIKTLKNNKSLGPGGIVKELVRIRKATQMVMFYRTNSEPLLEEWTPSYFKKGDKMKCAN